MAEVGILSSNDVPLMNIGEIHFQIIPHLPLIGGMGDDLYEIVPLWVACKVFIAEVRKVLLCL